MAKDEDAEDVKAMRVILAGLAMQGILASNQNKGPLPPSEVIPRAIAYSDALMEELGYDIT